jgi:hypothetical protein
MECPALSGTGYSESACYQNTGILVCGFDNHFVIDSANPARRDPMKPLMCLGSLFAVE